MIRPAALVLLALSLAAPALAQTRPAAPPAPAAAPAPAAPAQKPLGKWGAWQGYSDVENRNPLCFLTAAPTASEPKDARRSNVYLQVYHRPAQKQLNVVTAGFGYAFKDATSTVVFEVDGQKFTLFTQGEAAWAYKDTDDKAIVEAMKRGNELVVRGTSARGTATIDRYSLGGFTAGLAEINKACNVR